MQHDLTDNKSAALGSTTSPLASQGRKKAHKASCLVACICQPCLWEALWAGSKLQGQVWKNRLQN